MRTSRSIQRRATRQFEFGLPSPPWMSYAFAPEMSSIRIHINGEPRHTVSLEGHPGVLSCILNHINRRPEPATGQEAEDDYHISFGGIDNATGDYVDWPRIELVVGDRIELEILESSDPFPLATRRPHGGDAAEYSKKDYIRTMAKQFGWEVIEHESTDQTNPSESGGGDRIAPFTPPTPPGMRPRTGRFQSDH